ncbi:MAG: nitrite reductase [Deltaproteobacteria bacterium]|nr:MAG: nitrite reductase [Deltaproteobacteria bacterium]
MHQTSAKTYCLIPDLRADMLTADQVSWLHRLAQQYQVKRIKITANRQVALLGFPPALSQALQEELGSTKTAPHDHTCLKLVHACPGKDWCIYGQQDTQNMQQQLLDLRCPAPLPAKLKIGISGCPRCCASSWVRDIGLIGASGGWRLVFGGNGAGRPRIADTVAKGLSDDEAVKLLHRCLEFYISRATAKQRTARFIERLGIDVFKAAVLDRGQTDPNQE